jgi:uncharacterized protein (DUF1778 family)
MARCEIEADMSITLDLSPEIERLLRQKAALQGLELETYLGHLAERDAQAVNGKTEAASVAHVFPADFDRLVDELSEGLPPLPTLPPDWSRAHLYADHD